MLALADNDRLPVATTSDSDRRGGQLRATYRCALAMLVSLLIGLMLSRGYGIDEFTAGGEGARRTEGEWTSVPWALSAERTPTELHLTVDPSACARVVRVDVVESPDTVRVTLWRRAMHSHCGALSVAVRLRAPIAGRTLVEGGDLGAFFAEH
jgi:hypothetical protein